MAKRIITIIFLLLATSQLLPIRTLANEISKSYAIIDLDEPDDEQNKNEESSKDEVFKKFDITNKSNLSDILLNDNPEHPYYIINTFIKSTIFYDVPTPPPLMKF